MAESAGQIVGQVVLETSGAQTSLNNLKGAAGNTATAFNGLNQSVNNLQKGTNQGTMALMSMNYIISDMPYGLRGVSNNIQMTVQQMAMMAAQSGGLKGALSSVGAALKGPMGLVIVFTALMSGLEIATNGIMGFGKGAKKTATDIKDLVDRYNDLTHAIKESSDATYESLLRERVNLSQSELTRLESKQTYTPLGISPKYLKMFGRQVLTESRITGTPEEIAAAKLKLQEEKKFVDDYFDKKNKSIEQSKQKEEALELKRYNLINDYEQKSNKEKEDAYNKLFESEQKMNLEIITDKYKREEEKASQEKIKREADIYSLVDTTMLGEEAIAEKKRLTALSEIQYNNEIADIRKKQADEIRDKELKSMDDMLSAVDRLGNALYRAFGQDAAWIQQIFALVQILGQVEKMSKSGKSGDTDGILGIVTSVLGFFGGFAGGGYTGNTGRNKIAGVVHGGEIVFEKPIVDRYGADLMMLRSQLQSAKGYAGGGMVGGSMPMEIIVYGKVDIDNGEIHLRKVMPGYERYRAKKYR